MLVNQKFIKKYSLATILVATSVWSLTACSGAPVSTAQNVTPAAKQTQAAAQPTATPVPAQPTATPAPATSTVAPVSGAEPAAQTQPAQGQVSSTQTAATDNWIVAENDIWLPVIDELGQHLQQAHDLFSANDVKGAASQLRSAANFLKTEAEKQKDLTSQNALKATATRLEKLADQVANGNVDSVDALNIELRAAYQTDIDYRLSHAEPIELAGLADMTDFHFKQAETALIQGNKQLASDEIHKAIAYVELEGVRASENAKPRFEGTMRDLEQAATGVLEGKITTPEELGRYFSLAHHVLASHHLERSQAALQANRLPEAIYELHQATNHLEQALNHNNHQLEGEAAQLKEKLNALPPDLAETPQFGPEEISHGIQTVNKALEKLGEDLGLNASVAPEAAPAAGEYIEIDDQTYIPVVDPLTRHLQAAHQAFADSNMAETAHQIRESAALLKEEALKPVGEPAKSALNNEAADLEQLAKTIEKGQMTDAQKLNAALLTAYQFDVDYRLANISAQEFSPVVEWPVTQLGNAVEAIAGHNNKEAAADIYKAMAVLRLDAARTTDPTIHTALETAITGLDQVAGQVSAGKLTSNTAIDQAILSAYHALANHHFLRAQAAQAAGNMQEAGQEINAAARYLDQTFSHLGRQMTPEEKTLAKEMNLTATKLISGTQVDTSSVSNLLERTGQQLNALGQELETTMHAPQ